MRRTIAAFDPGGTTGYAVLMVETESPESPPILISSGQFLTWSRLPDIIVGNAVALVVVERFHLFPHKAKEQIGSDFIAAQVIGVAHYLCEQHGIPIVIQEPQGNVNSFFSDRRLREIGYVPSGASNMHAIRHELDAIRHGLHYLHFRERYAYREEGVGDGVHAGGSPA